MQEITIIILACLIMGFFLWRQDKKKKAEELSNRLYIAENNITYLKNRLHKKQFKQLSFLATRHSLQVARIYRLATNGEDHSNSNPIEVPTHLQTLKLSIYYSSFFKKELFFLVFSVRFGRLKPYKPLWGVPLIIGVI